MWKTLFFYIVFAIHCWAQASECDHYNALMCIKSATIPVGWLSEPMPNCNAWYDCISQHKCTPEEVDILSQTHCSAIETCGLGNWDLVNNCYVDERNCSDLRSCLYQSSCSELADWVYSQYCKTGQESYCNAASAIEARECISSEGSQASCSALQDCLTKNDRNCDVVLKYQLDLSPECNTFSTDDGAGETNSYSLLLLGINIAVMIFIV